MFKPTANAGGKGGVLDRDNPLLEEKFAVIGDGEHEYVLLSFCSSFVFERESICGLYPRTPAIRHRVNH